MKTLWPTEITEEALARCRDTDEMYDVVMADATAFYERREQELSPRVMREVEGNKAKAARVLGISRTQLYGRLRKYGLDLA